MFSFVQSKSSRQASYQLIESLSLLRIQHQTNLVRVSYLSNQWDPHEC